MSGRCPNDYKLQAGDRRYLNEVTRDGQVIQRIANRARALLALDRGARRVEIVEWLGVSRSSLWYLWQRYEERGVEAIFDEERSGRPPVFSPSRTCQDRAPDLHRASSLWIESESLSIVALCSKS